MIQLGFLVWWDSSFVNLDIQVEFFCQVHKAKFCNLFDLLHSDHKFCKDLLQENTNASAHLLTFEVVIFFTAIYMMLR